LNIIKIKNQHRDIIPKTKNIKKRGKIQILSYRFSDEPNLKIKANSPKALASLD
jgi:hypothetical protein